MDNKFDNDLSVLIKKYKAEIEEILIECEHVYRSTIDYELLDGRVIELLDAAKDDGLEEKRLPGIGRIDVLHERRQLERLIGQRRVAVEEHLELRLARAHQFGLRRDGAVGQALLPPLLRHCDVVAER